MSYPEGTTVRLKADVFDPATKVPVTPAEIVLTIVPPDGVPLTRTLSAGEVKPDLARPGRFYYLLEPDQPGTWEYEFTDPTNEATISKRKVITVSRRLLPV